MIVKNKKEYYSLRKLKGGVASVLVGALLLTGTSVAMAEELSGLESSESQWQLIDGDEDWDESEYSQPLGEGHVLILDGEGRGIYDSFPPGSPESDWPGVLTSKVELPEFPKESEGKEQKESEKTPESTPAPKASLAPETSPVPTPKIPEEQPKSQEIISPAPPKLELGEEAVTVTPPEGDVTAVNVSAVVIPEEGEDPTYISIDADKVDKKWNLRGSGVPIKVDSTSGQWIIPLDRLGKGTQVTAKSKSKDGESEEQVLQLPGETPESIPAPEVTPAPELEKAPMPDSTLSPAPMPKSSEKTPESTPTPKTTPLPESEKIPFAPKLTEEELVAKLLKDTYTIFLYTDKEWINYPFYGSQKELEEKLKETIEAYKSGHYPYVERFQTDKRVLLHFYKEKYLLRVISGEEGSRQQVETPFYDKKKLEDRVKELEDSATDFDILRQEDKDQESDVKRVTLTFTRKVEKKIDPELHEEKPFFPETEAPKATPDSSTHKPRGLDLGSSKQGLSEEKLIMGFLDSAYAIFLRTDKEQIGYPFYGSPEKLEEKIKETIEAYKSGHYPYVERFQTDKRVLLHFYKEKYLLRVISGEEGNRQQVETPFYDKKKLEDRVKELEDGAEGYDVFKQEDEDKDKKSYIKRVTLTFTRKVEKIEPELHEEKPFFPETEVPQNPATPEKSEEPQKSESQKSPEVPSKSETQKSPEVPSKSETQKSPEAPSKSETQKSPEVPSKSETQKSSELSQNPENLQKPKVPMTSAISNATTMAQPQQVKQLPATGDLPSALTWLGGSLLGLLGAIYQKKKD
ncbi:YSIRK-type signal peptide-containing protein [Streptococcus sp. S784/96/1]|uniref:YSIRK-type signal peptide-containing protein n=1 Tax=Streptococcus sp. S784/96/1 TaxID=2653499 RepID=UPI0012EA237C|nr:YSIRK-type signal peptide-containing protein [Streptococcus sp. S784/96/1]